MANTTNLQMPLLAAAQAQKHVTHNDALQMLDALVQLAVINRGLTAPPASPADGDRYMPASGATGAWADWDLNIAWYVDGVWTKLVPREGWLCWVAEEAVLLIFSGGAWEVFSGQSGGGSGREVLTGPRTYYVRADGSDSNDGRANTAQGAFATLQKAYDIIAATLDLGGHTVTVKVGPGTHAPLLVDQPWTGGGGIIVEGDMATPANVVVHATNAGCFETHVILPGVLRIRGFKLRTTSSGNGIAMWAAGAIRFANMDFGACASWHMSLQAPGALIVADSDYTISGGANGHMVATGQAKFDIRQRTITLTGTPAFTSAFAYVVRLGLADITNNSFVGAATGKRYHADLNGAIFAGGAGLPGSVAGTVATGGQYV